MNSLDSGFQLVALFFVLNTLLLLPGYAASGFSSGILDLIHSKEKKSFKLLIRRPTRDPLRLSLDLVFICCVSFIPEFGISISKAVFFTILIFAIYTETFLKLYGKTILYNDFESIVLATKIYFLDYSIKKLWQPILLLLVVYGTAFVLDHFLYSLNLLLNLNNKLIFVSAGSVLLVAYIFKFGFVFNHDISLHVRLLGIKENIVQSIHAHRICKLFKSINFDAFQSEAKLKLSKKPNIIIIFVESYGQVAYQNSAFTKSIEFLENKVASSKWHCASSLSQAPVTGGLSWLSYSSFIHGFLITNNSSYHALLTQDQTYHFSFIQQLKSQGYKNFRLSSIKSRPGFGLDQFTNFYSVDQWISFDDLAYNGRLHGFGPSIPDQYSINKGLEMARSESQTMPFSLFFITQDTHYPFISPAIEANWQKHNIATNENFESQFFKKPEIKKYFVSIENQLKMLGKTILENGASDDIYILIGDHQPPLVPSENHHTPVHVFSQNAVFTDSLKNYGFTDGLSNIDFHGLKHEGLQSLFTRELTRHFGESDDLPIDDLPIYYPNGLDLKI